MKRPSPPREDSRSLPSRDERRNQFVQRYLELAPRLALATRYWMSAGTDEASDALQTLLVAFLERIDSSDTLLLVEKLSSDELRKYIGRAVRNHLIDRKRRDEIIQRNYEVLIDGLELAPLSPEALLAESEAHEIVRQSVAALHAPYRELLQALLDDDITLAELARRRKIKRGTIYTQFSRAIEALRVEWRHRTEALHRRGDSHSSK